MSEVCAERIYLRDGDLKALIAVDPLRPVRFTFGFGGEERTWLKHNDGWEAKALAKIRADRPAPPWGRMPTETEIEKHGGAWFVMRTTDWSPSFIDGAWLLDAGTRAGLAGAKFWPATATWDRAEWPQ